MQDADALQLAHIREVAALLGGAGVPHWLFGGWAATSRSGGSHGRTTMWSSSPGGATSRACAPCWRRAATPRCSREDAAAWRKDGVLVEVDRLERDARGRPVTPGPWRDWPWPDGAFGAPAGRLGDLACPIVSPAAQLETKGGYAAHPAGRPPRPKDLADMARLRQAIAAGEELGVVTDHPA